MQRKGECFFAAWLQIISVLAGVLPSGETKQAGTSWNVAKNALPGDHGGTLHVSGEDEWGNATAFDLPVALTVEERNVEPRANVKTADLRAAGDRRLIYSLAGASALLLATFVVRGILVKRQNQKSGRGKAVAGDAESVYT